MSASDSNPSIAKLKSNHFEALNSSSQEHRATLDKAISVIIDLERQIARIQGATFDESKSLANQFKPTQPKEEPQKPILQPQKVSSDSSPLSGFAAMLKRRSAASGSQTGNQPDSDSATQTRIVNAMIRRMKKLTTETNVKTADQRLHGSHSIQREDESLPSSAEALIAKSRKLQRESLSRLHNTQLENSSINHEASATGDIVNLTFGSRLINKAQKHKKIYSPNEDKTNVWYGRDLPSWASEFQQKFAWKPKMTVVNGIVTSSGRGSLMVQRALDADSKKGRVNQVGNWLKIAQENAQDNDRLTMVQRLEIAKRRAAAKSLTSGIRGGLSMLRDAKFQFESTENLKGLEDTSKPKSQPPKRSSSKVPVSEISSVTEEKHDSRIDAWRGRRMFLKSRT